MKYGCFITQKCNGKKILSILQFLIIIFIFLSIITTFGYNIDKINKIA